MDESREREAQKRKIPPFAYIGVREYRRRLGLIQETIYASLAQNDARFGGDDGIEGGLVFGSHAKSFPLTKGRTLVHNKAIIRHEVIKASDLDIAYFTRSNLPRLTEINNDDRKIPIFHPWVEFFPEFEEELRSKMLNPVLRLNALILHGLEQQGIFTSIENHHYLNYEMPDQMSSELGEDEAGIINGFGLAFIPEASTSRQAILAVLRKAKFPIVLNPATAAEVLSPNATS